MELGRDCVPRDEEACVILLSSIEIGSDFDSFCRSIFTTIEINYVVGDWLRKQAILSTENAKLKETKAFAEAYISDKTRTFPRTDTMETEHENALRYPIEMLNNLSQRSALQDHMLSMKK